MAYVPTAIRLSADERRLLERNVRAAKTEQRLALRSRIALLAADGLGTNAIAAQLHVSPATVSKWRLRFACTGLAAPRRTPQRRSRQVYAGDRAAHPRQARRTAPAGRDDLDRAAARRELTDVSEDQVWRVFRRHGIHLQRRRSWCVSTDPQFAAKAADIVALYLAPPRTRSSSASMRSRRSRHWSVPRATCAFPTDGPSRAFATATSGTARRPSSAPSRWPPAS